MSSRRGGKRASAAAAAGAPAPPAHGQAIVRATDTRGGNQVEVERADGAAALVLLPPRFHKTLWIKRGGYLVVTEEEGDGKEGGSKVSGEVVSVLYRDDVRALRAMPGVWPPEFADDEDEEPAARPAAATASVSGSDSDGAGLPPLAANPNRRRPTYETSSSEEEDEEGGGGGGEEAGGA